MDSDNNVVNLKKNVEETPKIKYKFRQNTSRFKNPTPLYTNTVQLQELRFTRVFLAVIGYFTWVAWIPSIIIDDNKYNKQHVNCAITIRLLLIISFISNSIRVVLQSLLYTVNSGIINIILTIGVANLSIIAAILNLMVACLSLFNILLAIIGDIPKIPVIKYINIFK